MRGKHVLSCCNPTQGRIIPAHAGQTPHLRSMFTPYSDHPRACGANVIHVEIRVHHCGSSPRMRGKPRARHVMRCARRIIPAHAGQTPFSATNSRSKKDHPRACGANHMQWLIEVFIHGSSPRMRGKQKLTQRVRVICRIIPAHAGQTSVSNIAATLYSDHPRACGANVISNARCNVIFGSSPRMRGKRRERQAAAKTRRIIPAHAGQTSMTLKSS